MKKKKVTKKDKKSKKTKKNKKISCILTVPIFDVQVIVRIGMSAEEANKETFDRYKLTPAEDFSKFTDIDNTKGQFIKINEGGYAVWIKNAEDADTLVPRIGTRCSISNER